MLLDPEFIVWCLAVSMFCRMFFVLIVFLSFGFCEFRSVVPDRISGKSTAAKQAAQKSGNFVMVVMKDSLNPLPGVRKEALLIFHSGVVVQCALEQYFVAFAEDDLLLWEHSRPRPATLTGSMFNFNYVAMELFVTPGFMRAWKGPQNFCRGFTLFYPWLLVQVHVFAEGGEMVTDTAR